MEAIRRHASPAGSAVRRLSCPETETDLDCETALAIVEPYFTATQEVFVDYEHRVHGQAFIKRVRLECSPLMHDAPRHFAGCAENGRLIAVAPHLAELPEEAVVGILAHELGHAMDFAYSGHYVIDDGELRERAHAVYDESDKRMRQALVAASRHWRDRDDDAVEKTADLIAERVTGRTIGYVGPCELQAFDRGSSRRPGLR
jgi:hypothetical protein